MHKLIDTLDKIVEKNIPIVGLILGGFVFFMLFGTKILDTSNIDWIMVSDVDPSKYFLGQHFPRIDPSQHFIGWHFFRSESWSFPLGMIKSYNYPEGTSLVYTDSIPLLAIPLKLISPLLPSIFQYQGLWILLSYLLMGFFATLLMKQITKNLICICLGALFFILSPIIVYRLTHSGGHDSLTSQWIILASMYLYFQQDSFKYKLMWLFLLLSAVMIHFYLFSMSFLFFLGYLLKVILEDKRKIKSLILQLSIVLITVFATMWIVGYFVISVGDAGHASNAGEERFGFYSMNLLSPINPQNDGISRFIKTWPTFNEQYEGFNYLGLGLILLIVISTYEALRQKLRFNFKILFPLLLIAVILVLISLSNRITIAHKILFEIGLPYQVESILSIFRSSGRLFWPVYYLLILTALTILIRYNSLKTTVLLLTFLLCIQVIDLSKYYSHTEYLIGSMSTLKQPLESNLWNRIMGKSNHVVIFPPEWVDTIPYTFGLLAANNKKTLNVAYLARSDDKLRSKYLNEISQELVEGKISEDTLYIMNKCSPSCLRRFKSKVGNKAGAHIWGELDGYFIIAPFLELSQADLSEFKPI